MGTIFPRKIWSMSYNVKLSTCLFVWLVIMAVTSSIMAEVTYHAVICGISDYEGSSNDLNYCDDDAADMRSALLSYPNWNSSNITMLTDSSATKTAIQNAIQTMAFNADADDVCVFFFSGHGTTGSDISPYDESDGYDEYLVTYDLYGIRDDELADWIDDLPTDSYAIFIDTCYSGGNIKSTDIDLRTKGIGSIVPDADDGFASDLVEVLSAKDLDDNGVGVVLTACDDDELSTESSTLQNGVFTYYLVQGINGLTADTGGDNWISAEECYSYTEPRAANYNSSQHAQIYDGYSGSLDFVGTAAVYCDASGGGDEYISGVQVGSINNVGTGSSNYADYTSLSTIMDIGTSYSITVANGNPYSSDQCGIWVDWNQDKDFDDSGETITVTGTPGNGPYTATITPPTTASLGNTRMRIRITYTGIVSPCGTTTYGEVEDYTISVSEAVPTPPAAPTGLTHLSSTTNSITWTWTDNSSDETGFYAQASTQSQVWSVSADVTSKEETGLSANTPYTRHVHAYNAHGLSSPSNSVTAWTLPAAPSVTCDHVSGCPAHPVGEVFTFANTAGFGSGEVDHYGYIWNQNATYMFSGSENSWSNGTLPLTAVSAGTWYLHVISYNGDDAAGGTINLGPFIVLDTPLLQSEPAATPGTCNTIEWNAADGADGYYAEAATDQSFHNVVANSGWIYAANHEFCSLNSGQTYWYRAKARTVSGGGTENWSQTSQAEFNTDTLSDVDAAAVAGDVVLATDGTGGEITGRILNPSFEVSGNWSYYETNFAYWYYLPSESTWVTDGSNTLYCYNSWRDSFSAGDYMRFTQNVDLTDVDTIKFDTKLDTSGVPLGTFETSVRIDAVKLWGQILFAEYYDEEIDVSAMSGIHELEIRQEALLAYPGGSCVWSWWDNFRTYGSFDYVASGSIVSTTIELPVNGSWDAVNFSKTTPADTSLTVDVLDASDDSVILTNVSNGNDLSSLTETEIKLRANLATADTAATPVLHGWSVTYANPVTTCETQWSNVELSQQAVKGDFEPDGDVDLVDLAIFASAWLTTPSDIGWNAACDISDPADSMVDMKDFAIFSSN